MGLFDRFRRTVIERSAPSAAGGVTLYYPGCYASAKAPHIIKATKEALRELGVEYVTLDIPCCGCVAWLCGYEDDFLVIRKRVTALLIQHKISRIITNDVECALTFKERYNIEAHHVIEILDAHIEQLQQRVTSQARYLHTDLLDRLGVPARLPLRVLRRAGVHVPREEAKHGCAPIDFARNDPEVAAALVRERIGSLPIVTCCPSCNLAYARQNAKVKDATELLGER